MKRDLQSIKVSRLNSGSRVENVGFCGEKTNSLRRVLPNAGNEPATTDELEKLAIFFILKKYLNKFIHEIY